MPLFACSKCGCAENTALGAYWVRSDGKGYHEEGAAPPLCSECASGQWHGNFPKRSAAGWSIDNHGFIWSPEEIERGQLPVHFKIVGHVPQPS